MELRINENLLMRVTAIKERQLNEMTKTQFHFYKLDEIGFLKCKKHIRKNLKQMAKWEQY
jgi:hypothetical protein